MKASADSSIPPETHPEDIVSQSAHARALGFDDFIEDLFGVNLRGLRTVRDSFTNPRQIARSANFPDWRDLHTPTFRIWFAMLALGLFSQFLWASPASGYFAIIQSGVERGLAQVLAGEDAARLASLDISAFTASYIKINFAILPFFMAALYFLIALVLRVTEDPTSFVKRQRLVFLAPLPGMAFSALAYIAMGFTPREGLPLFLGLLTLTSSVLFIVTSYRGIFRWGEPLGRFGRSLGFFALHFGAILIASLAAQVIAISLTLPRFI